MYETGPSYRVGALILGIKNYRFGANSEHVRHAVQDRVIHGMIGNAGFRNMLWNWRGFSQFRSRNMFSSW
ncbi:polymorphic toxin type 23 domain-containing protein [Pedobacter sp. ASV28]|uniref:polymorphic toxin type 23 domain-containing protein n=1 Tax=Pedobacter sp. ASV28 TaxID=2795123 RepID=UPI0018EE34A9|nr:polymorphic toxin type 23 domain-containing protein [Pedobacter sp. ASV28]